MSERPHVKGTAVEIAKLGFDMPPHEFLAALAVATGAAIAACWPKELHDTVTEAHCDNVRDAVGSIDQRRAS